MDENNGLQLSKNVKKKKSRELLKEMRERDSKAAEALAAEQKPKQEVEPAPKNTENAEPDPKQSGFTMESAAAVSAAGAAAKSQSDYMEEFREIKQQLAAEAPRQAAAMPGLASAAKPLDDDIRNSKEYQDFKSGKSGASSAPKQSKPLPPSIAAAAKEAQEKHLLSDSAKQMIVVFAVIAFIFIGLCLFSLVGNDQQIPTASPSASSKTTTTTTTASGGVIGTTDSSGESIVTTASGQSDISGTTTVKQNDTVTSKDASTSNKTTTTTKSTTTTAKKTTTTAKQTNATTKKTTTTTKKTTTTAKQTTTTAKKTTTTTKKTTTTAKKTTTTAKKTTTTKVVTKTGLTLDKGVSAWGSGNGKYGASMNLSIENNTSENIENWKITITVPAGTSVTGDPWGCKYKLSGTTLTLIPDENAAYNLIVSAGGSISMGVNLESTSEMTAENLKASVTY